MMGWYQDGTGGGGWVVMILAMVVFWALVVFAVVAIFRGTRDVGTGTGNARRDPKEILEERFARGEIDVDEYRARMDVLRAGVR
jgi:putative membrane protein